MSENLLCTVSDELVEEKSVNLTSAFLCPTDEMRRIKANCHTTGMNDYVT